jgi:hypothetical protein
MMRLALLLVLQDSGPEGWTPAEQMNARSVSDVQPSPDGRRAVFTVTTPSWRARRANCSRGSGSAGPTALVR